MSQSLLHNSDVFYLNDSWPWALAVQSVWVDFLWSCLALAFMLRGCFYFWGHWHSLSLCMKISFRFPLCLRYSIEFNHIQSSRLVWACRGANIYLASRFVHGHASQGCNCILFYFSAPCCKPVSFLMVVMPKELHHCHVFYSLPWFA